MAARRGTGQHLMVWLCQRLGRPLALLLIASATASLSSAIMAWLGAALLHALGHVLGLGVGCAVLGLAVLGILRPVELALPVEPTRSFGAIGLAMLAHQIADPVRLMVAAAALMGLAPLFAAIAGALGSGGAFLLAWHGAKAG